MALKLGSVLAGCALLAASVAYARATPPGEDWASPELQRDGLGYPVSDLRFAYPFNHPDLPDPAWYDSVVVLLTPTSDGYIGVLPDGPIEAVRLGDVGADGAAVVYGSALAAINQGVRDALENEWGLIGHLVTPDAAEIAYQSSRADLRASKDTELTVLVWRAAVGAVRTVAAGDRIGEAGEDSSDGILDGGGNVDHPSHERLRDRIRIAEGDLLTRGSIDAEIARQGRHPGRSVEAAVSPGTEPGEVVVDLLINEPKQWSAYAQASNTGTESTNEWQYRIGYADYQLTGRDDIFRFDYITAGFDESHALLGSYEFDLGPVTRLAISGRWNEYVASDVGLGFENFTGEGWSFGAEISRNIHQNGDRFLDLFAGVRYESIDVENRVFLIEGSEDFVLPSIGVRWQRATPLLRTYFETSLEGNLATLADSDEIGVQELGRFGVDDDWVVLKTVWSHSRFLEPWFDPAGFRGDRGEEGMRLAHELAVSVRGQYAFGARLVPNFQMVAGGFSSVRGYPESVAVGDDVIIGSAEYRYHLGRAGGISPEPVTLFGRPFRAQRTRPYGSADWDVILKGFIDAARVSPNDAPFFETQETLVGVGVGIEARLRRNLTMRLDYGMALTPIGEGAGRTVDVGDTRLNFSATILY
ncbi:MAG: ShlB/FhaC/HecB family hemolysin secretion/activation protein [Planctomycetota bacterium]